MAHSVCHTQGAGIIAVQHRTLQLPLSLWNPRKRGGGGTYSGSRFQAEVNYHKAVHVLHFGFKYSVPGPQHFLVTHCSPPPKASKNSKRA